jgi:hypothetical protein
MHQRVQDGPYDGPVQATNHPLNPVELEVAVKGEGKTARFSLRTNGSAHCTAAKLRLHFHQSSTT